MYKRENLVFEGGERYATLIDDDGVPDFWVTLFVTVQLRPTHSQNAILAILQDIAHFKLWEQVLGRDVLSEIREGNFLSDIDAVSLRDHCANETRSVRKWLESSPRRNVVDFGRVRSIKTTPFRRVGKAHQANRIIHIAQFLDFVARTMLRNRANFGELNDLISDMRIRLINQKPKMSGKGPIREPDLKVASPQIFEELMECVKEGADENPFKNKGIKFRNALIFEVLYHTGIRSSELLSLHVEDVTFGPTASVEIRRRHDDPIDPRAHQPVQKTLGRTIPIPLELAERLRKYIIEVRATIKGANRHPFIFVTHHAAKSYQGRPISDSTFRNRILRPVVKSNYDLFDEITRHGFRHNFNYQLSKKIDAHNKRAKENSSLTPISEKEEIQIRKQLNGWESDSTAAGYNLRHIKETADALLREDSQQQMKGSKEG